MPLNSDILELLTQPDEFIYGHSEFFDSTLITA